MRTKILSALKVSLLALSLSFGLSFVYAWTAPTQNPPAGNVSAPINTSATAQTKAGNLTVSATTTSSYFADLASPAFFVQPSGTSNFWDITVAGTTTTKGLKVLNGAGAGKVLTSDASGNATWTATSSATLGLGGGGAQQQFIKTGLPITAGFGTATFAHGLGSVPTEAHVYLVCKTAEANYAVGDMIDAIAVAYYASGDVSKTSLSMNATNITIGYNGNRLAVGNKTTSALVFITPANWTFTIIATIGGAAGAIPVISPAGTLGGYCADTSGSTPVYPATSCYNNPSTCNGGTNRRMINGCDTAGGWTLTNTACNPLCLKN